MQRFVFSSILGVFIFNEEFVLIDKRLFKNLNEYESKQFYMDELKKKHKDLADISSNNNINRVLEEFKRQEFFAEFHEKNLELTKLDIKSSVKTDNLLIQATSTMEELEKTINLLVKRLREWYELYNPEISKLILDHKKFIYSIIKKSKQEILDQIGLSGKMSMGSELGKDDVYAIINLANQVNEMYNYKESLEDYTENIMKELCPNLHGIAGVSIGSKLIRHAGSLERLALLPASTIQILGAEKALFRHLTKKAKMPKYGVIFQHPLISKVQRDDRGKAARALADKISIAAKVDRFKGKFIADQLIEELQRRFKVWK